MSLQIYAPSLRSLPEHAMLVMATLPIIDWNDCLLRELRAVKKRAPVPAYAAIVMIDPFACWEDFADLLKDAEITGIINFPPASILERSSGGVAVDTGQELELRRMEWFAGLGFKVLFAAANESDITAAELRLGSQLDGVVYLPAEALALTIGTDIGLVSLGAQGSSVPKFALLDATAARRPLPT